MAHGRMSDELVRRAASGDAFYRAMARNSPWPAWRLLATLGSLLPLDCSQELLAQWCVQLSVIAKSLGPPDRARWRGPPPSDHASNHGMGRTMTSERERRQEVRPLN